MNRVISSTFIFVLLLAVGAPAQAQGSANLLVNPGFEGLYSKQCCENTNQFQPNTPIDKVQVSFGWTAWWVEPDASHPNHCTNCNPWSRPEFRYSTLIHSGSSSQFYFTSYAIHQAGVFQRVTGVKAGQRLQFSAYMQATSTKDNSFELKVGIDPTGGVNPFSRDVVWGPSYSALGSWLLFSAEAVAQNSAVTVFTYSRPAWAHEFNSIYLDDASLIVTGAGAANVSGPSPSTYTLSQNSSGTVASPSGTTTPGGLSGNTYVVKRGDNLSRLARRFGVTVDALKAANGLKTDVIRIGQVLIIPGK